MMKSKGIILVALLCIFAISGCSKETNTATTNSETSSTQITTSESISAGETSVKNRMTIILKDNETGNLLENKVVLIKPKDGETKVTGFENITDAENMALAGEDVPVGQYSREIFNNLGIMDDVNEMEINECKNVTDVLAAVSEGSNEVGVVYATDAASVADKVEIIAEVPADSLQTPVLYPVGLIEDKEASEDDTKAAEAFLDYVESDAAIKVFEDYGFTAYKAEDSKEDAEDSADSTEAEDSTDSTGSTSK